MDSLEDFALAPLARLLGQRALEVIYLVALALHAGLPSLLVGVGCLTLAGWLWVGEYYWHA